MNKNNGNNENNGNLRSKNQIKNIQCEVEREKDEILKSDVERGECQCEKRHNNGKCIEKANNDDGGMKGTLKSKIILMLSGVATGFANGFFGGGGGMITVPVLSRLLKYEEKKSHATALLVILPISIFSSISYVVNGSIDWKTAGFVAIGVIAGGIVGAVFLKKISNKVLTYLFAVIMIVVGVKMFL